MTGKNTATLRHLLLLSLVPIGTQSAWGLDEKSPPKEIFSTLLKEYKHFTDCHPLLPDEVESIKKLDLNLMTQVPESQLRPRFDKYNIKYLQYRKMEEKVLGQVRELEKRLKETPLSDLKNRGDLEVKHVAINARHIQVKKSICMQSVEANKDIQAALDSLPSDKKAVAQATPVKNEAKPKLPGIMNESRTERMKKSETEKIFLTPVDDEFYATQLGKKLEKDLGGRAEYWSYDYDKDDLYVKVGNDVGKLSVREDSPGIRYIRTRFGASFVEPKGKDTQVDNLAARGKFFTRDPDEESLFGPFPRNTTKFSDENKKPTPGKGAHDHKH